MKKKIISILLSIASISMHVHAVTKHADEVFTKWNEWQHILPKVDITQLSDNITDAFVKKFKNNYENTLPEANHYRTLLKNITNNQINEYGYRFNPSLDEQFAQNLKTIYQLTDKDIPGLMNFLKGNGFTDTSSPSKDNLVEKNLALTSLLFSHPDDSQQEALNFSVANSLFRFCFGEKTFPMFHKMLLDRSCFELTRYLYSTIWYNLAGAGWKNWSQETLKRLAQEAQQGKSFVYIAGGSDLYQLLKAGVYNVRVIDPQLPSQTKYYTNEWSWFTIGNQDPKSVGDEIIYKNGDSTITLKRIVYHETGETFQARLANGQIVLLPKSVTVWNITNDKQETLGSYIFERRFVHQQDFNVNPHESLLMSFNELFFICSPDHLNGWGIEPAKFPQTTTIHIKQLHEPVNKQHVCNMRVATALNSTDLQYISLGTCIN